MKKKHWESLLMLAIFLVMAAVTLLPFVSIFLASLRPGKEIMRQGIGLNIDPAIMSFRNYGYLFSDATHVKFRCFFNLITLELPRYFAWFLNSVRITAIQTVLTLFVSAFVGYGFAMYDFRGKNLLFTCVLIIMMIPLEIIMLPLYQLTIRLKLINTIWGIILPGIAGPMPIFFFRQYLSGIQRDFVDAARIDGCTEYGIFFRIILPLMKPSLAAMGIFIGMNSWNSFLWPMMVLRDNGKLTLPIGLNSLLTPYGNNYELLIAGAVFSILPIILLFILFQKYFIAGMTAGGVKG